ncbi:hypothetical protein MM26B8_05430 [Mycoplasmopsis meleagridis]|uniref:Impact N-terminal domain-containing protein n=1 Tax=Mycoplasmopsis meleagridis ATCC 25294 TaxID=1264554 RepID=A0A0F5H009_9BACT|nr:YigZ family protein [Mycoplasmopsis meleagridis]KKB26651.1 hypothetical protein MMELEA_00320 [Mycoplasmopsis meleagridis ATCC 25294]OAD18234.1 hypothetical protein MM26B8_05430 [Mycoplasmopsis meleagridis]VEU77705.1 proline dipeptidase pepQ [Mycoplasmopsis meleagridis]
MRYENWEYQEIKKSKFYSKAYLISNKNQLHEKIREVTILFKKPTHICYAYVFNDNNVIYAGFNDDNEPKNTAGKPILNVLQFKKTINIVVFVVRYFGGIQLGASGLIRAYSKMASLAYEKIK